MTDTKCLLLAAATAAMAFTVSCMSESGLEGGGNSFGYCLINERCLEGPFTSKECGDLGGLPSNSCGGGGSCAGFDPKAEVVHYDKNKKQFCDERDGNKYVYVTIGSQTWMAENLNYGGGSSRCYQDNTANCAKYGRLYNWYAAITVACPLGWHLPSHAEWATLTDYVGGDSIAAGRNLKATSGWDNNGNGTDEYGFSALPGGYGGSDGSFDYAGIGYWWSASEGSSNSAYSRIMGYSLEYAYWRGGDKSYLFSVRCLQD